MPRGDGRGPAGMGTMTGRAAGFCAGFGMPGYSNPALGRGFAMGSGRERGGRQRQFCRGGRGGRGWRDMFYATGRPGWLRFGGDAAPGPAFDPELEKLALKNQAEILQRELDFVKKRLGDIETGPAGE